MNVVYFSNRGPEREQGKEGFGSGPAPVWES